MDFKNIKKISILGIARSGTAAALFLKKKGYDIFISDIKKIDDDDEFILQLKNNNINFETGKHSLSILSNSDLIVVSPGIPLDSNIICELKNLNKKIIGEIELAYQFCNKRSKIIAVTGSNGKSTTTSLIGEILKGSGLKVIVAGNIGSPWIKYIDEIDDATVVVLELSSFQIDTLYEFRPNISIILNITPNHLDRYNSFLEYKKSKFKITDNQYYPDYFVLNSTLDFDNKKNLNIIKLNDDSQKNNFVNMFDKNRLNYSINGISEHINFNSLFLRGTHNYENIAASASAALILKIDEHLIKTAIENFKGLEHRLEFVKEKNGIKFYNDSKATTPEAAIKAINSFDNNVVLLLGGRDKGTGFKNLKFAIKNKVKFTVLFGEAKELIKNDVELIDNFFIANSFDEAVKKAYNISTAGDVVLLAPACTSYDMFKNFEERGKIFKELVNNL